MSNTTRTAPRVHVHADGEERLLTRRRRPTPRRQGTRAAVITAALREF